MKKYLFILGLVGTALFTACSTADDLTAEEPNMTPSVEDTKEAALIVEASQNSEVPVTLGVGQSRGNTRAPIGGESGNPAYESFHTEAGKYIGVFCLATGYQSSYTSNPPIANNWTDNDGTGLIVRMKNVPATVFDDGTVAFYNHARTSGQNYYYPMGDWMKYNFYAYYPWQDEELDGNTLVFKNNRVLEKYYDIDGSQDIIWGVARPEEAEAVSPAATDADPYCAKYIRMKRKEVGEANIANHYPKLKFEHKLVQFRFFVKAAKATDEETDHTIRNNLTNLNAQVTDMYIGNAINRLMVVVADQSSVNNTDGTLYWFGNTLNTKKLGIKANGVDTDRFPGTAIPEDGDTDGHPDWVDAINVASDSPVGYIMLAPPTVRGVNYPDVENNHVYQLYLKVQYDNGSGSTETNLVTLSLNPPSGGFIAGKIYNIIVNVQSPEKITVKAVLQQWESGSTIEYGND